MGAMTRGQQQAIEILESILGYESGDARTCSGDAHTCKNDECMVCGVRDCPDREPLHYHHDGCPACWQKEAANGR